MAVQFVITNPASFNVIITGEVVAAGEVTTWSLRRLGDVVADNLTDYASTRQIIVEASDGTQKKYDLFQAERFGNMSQNPYLRPGDKIIVPRFERKVKILGAVRRPGEYELLPGEQIQDLINVLGDGYTDAQKQETGKLFTYKLSSSTNILMADEDGNIIHVSDEDKYSNISIAEGHSSEIIIFTNDTINYPAKTIYIIK